MNASFHRAVDRHHEHCPGLEFEDLGGGCVARGTDYNLKCLQCGEVFSVGKDPGRREYFAGSDEEYVKGTILEESEHDKAR